MMERTFSWEAPERTYTAHSKEFMKNVGIVVVVVSLIFAFAQQWFVIFVLAALYFVFYAMSTVKPEMVTHQITSQGIVTGEKEYFWDQLDSYWFSEKNGVTCLNVRTKEQVSKILFMILGEGVKAKLTPLLEEKLKLITVPPVSWEERLINRISGKLSFD